MENCNKLNQELIIYSSRTILNLAIGGHAHAHKTQKPKPKNKNKQKPAKKEERSKSSLCSLSLSSSYLILFGRKRRYHRRIFRLSDATHSFATDPRTEQYSLSVGIVIGVRVSKFNPSTNKFYSATLRKTPGFWLQLQSVHRPELSSPL